MNFCKKAAFIFLIITLLAILMSSICSVSAAGTVYVSNTGSDSNAGTTSSPFQTMLKAYNTLGTSGGTIVVINSVPWNYKSLPSHTGMITITGKDPSTGILYSGAAFDRSANRDSRILGPTTFEYIKDKPQDNYGAIYANGNKLVIGNSFGLANTLKTQIVAVRSTSTASKADITINSGAFTDFEINAYNNCAISGDVNVVLNDGITSMGGILLGSDTGSVTVNGVVGLTVNGDVGCNTVRVGAVTNYSNSYTTTLNKGYQIIFNNANSASNVVELNSTSLPLIVNGNKYIIYCSGQGSVSHAYDAQGNIKPGYIKITTTGAGMGPKIDGLSSADGEVAITPGTHHITFASTNEFSIVYNTNGGTGIAPISGIAKGTQYSTSTAVKAITSKAGYIFAGWYADSNLTAKVPSSISVNSDVVLYAKFIAAPSQDFELTGVKIRALGDQGFRFITKLNKSGFFTQLISENTQNSSIYNNANFTVGVILLEYNLLRKSELVKDGKYPLMLQEFTPSNLQTNIRNEDSSTINFNSDYLGVNSDKYGIFYSVRPYFGYYTVNGVYNTYYGTPYKARIYSIAMDAYNGDLETNATKLDFKTNIIDVTEPVNSAPVVMDATSTYLASLDTKANGYKQKTLNSQSNYTVGAGGTIYFVSNHGSDTNDGKSPSTAWATITKVNTANLNPGDVILFERGGKFRGFITGRSGVTYSAYGTGAKPILIGSAQNYADPLLWTLTSTPNVYVYNGNITNVGIIAFDHTGEIGNYNQKVGTMKIAGVDGFVDETDLTADLQFYSNLTTNKLYIYSSTGVNPGTRFSSIEIGTKTNIFSVGVDNVTVDNLHVTLTGAHGLGGGNRKNLTVRNNIFDWLGGSILNGYGGGNTTRYGNAVETYGGCDGFFVTDNWMYQIYDTGVTHQFSASGGNCHMNNIVYLDNLIEYCYWSIEIYNAIYGTTDRSISNVYMKGNFCRFGGYGWGCAGRAGGAPMFSSGNVTPNVDNCLAEENIFDRCLGYLVSIGNYEGNKQLVIRNNTYVQPYGAKFALLFGKNYYFDETALSNLVSLVGEENPTIAFIR